MIKITDKKIELLKNNKYGMVFIYVNIWLYTLLGILSLFKLFGVI